MSILDFLSASSFPDDQDQVTLGGVRIPGMSVPTKAGAPFKWTELTGNLTTGASLMPAGGGLSAFDIQVALWKEEQFGDWDRFAKAVLVMDKPKPPYGVSISHPLVSRAPLNIKSVVIENISQWEQDDYGLYTCAISVRAYRAPKPFLVKAAGPTPGFKAGTATAADAKETQILQLTDQLGKL